MDINRKLYGDISKVEEQDDGTIKVYGYASSEAVDSDGEIIKADAMDAAIADYMKFPAVREMHQPIAAGTGLVMKVEADGRTWFGAHIVDPTAVKKVQTKVYRGFSIGARVTSRDDANKAVITGLKLKEVSLVDRPANPEATIELWKAEDLGDDAPPAEEVDAVDELAKLLNDKTIDAKTLLDLAKAHKAAPLEPEAKPEPDTQKADHVDDIKKGMYEVARLAELVEAVDWSARMAAYEADAEGDGSPMPARLKQCVADLGACLKDMIGEELDELLAAKKAEREAELKKAGAKYSKATKGALAGVHKMIRECDKALADMGYEDAEDDEGKADVATDVQKAEAPAPAPDELAKAVKTIEGLGSQLRELVTKVEKLEAEPVAPKGKLLAVEKADEVAANQGGGAGIKFDLVKKSDGTVDDTASAIKLIHRIGGQRLDPFGN
jgi:phage head maturation protease